MVSVLPVNCAGLLAEPGFEPASWPDLTLEMNFDMALIMVISPFVPERTQYGMNRTGFHRRSGRFLKALLPALSG